MLSKTQKFIQTVNENPDREIIFMYPDEGSDHAYTMGKISRILVDEYWIDDERVWLKNEDSDELFDKIADDIFDDLYPKHQFATDEQSAIIDKKAGKDINELNWKKAIIVYIHY